MIRLRTIVRPSKAEQGRRRDQDFYPTPRHAIDALLDEAPPPRDVDQIIEPAAGDGAIVRVLVERGYRHIWCVDTRAVQGKVCAAGADAFVRGDWLEISRTWPVRDGRPRAIVTNPPFSIAREFAEACLATHAIYVALLLRINVEASGAWREFWTIHPWTRRVPLWKRPSFTGDGHTDGCNYIWAIWDR